MRAEYIEAFEPRVLLTAGQLDPFFGTGNGYFTFDSPGGSAQIVDFETRPDGKILAVGTYDPGSGTKLFLARFGSAGGLDTTFGTGGVVQTNLAGSEAVLKLLKRGQFLVASGSQVVRYVDSGLVDATFVQNEPSRYKFNFRTLAIDVQPDGKILLSGRYKHTLAKSGHFAVARLKASGGRDSTFGTGGVADFWQQTNSKASAVKAMADGSIYVAGDLNRGYPNDLSEFKNQDALCVRLTPTGALDPNYGVAGVAKLSGRFFAGSNMKSTLAPDGTATIVAAGDDNTIFRITPAGVADTTFDGNGTAVGPYFAGGQVIITSSDDGSALMSYVDYTTPQPPRVDKIVRWTAAGAQDNSWGTSGKATFQIGSTDTIINSMQQETDGSILIAGQADGKPMLARLWSDEAPAVRITPRNVKVAGGHRVEMRVQSRDDGVVNERSMTGSAFEILTPTGATLTPAVVEVGTLSNDRFCYGTMLIAAPGGTWDAADNGEYTIRLLGNRISDAAGHFSLARTIGTFWVNVG